MKYVCPCGYEYDPAKGDPDNGIAPGTPWEEVPEDFECPICGLGKDAFENEKFLTDCAAIYSSMEMPWLHRVEADGTVEEVHAAIREIIKEELGI